MRRRTRPTLRARGAAALLTVALSGLGCGAQDDARAEALLAAIGDRAAAVRVGDRVLAQEPSWGDAERLRSELSEGGPGDLDSRVREDFAAGRVLRVDGWLLSETEARVYALLALDTPR